MANLATRGRRFQIMTGPSRSILTMQRHINNRGVVYDELGDQRQAISDYDRAIEINPDYAKAYFNRGIAYGKLGYDSKAIEDLKTAAKFDSEEAKKFLRSRGINW